MAINIKFDLAGNPEPPTIILATRSGNKLGLLDVDPKSIDLSDKFNDASEFSFTLNKYKDNKLTNLWEKVVNFKLVYCIEWDTWFEITVELDEETETVKTVFCTQLGQAELSQVNLYDVEINTEEDIARDDYKISILYDKDDPEASILNRMLEKAPHYSIGEVDDTIAKIQRSFSFDGDSIYDGFEEVAEEIGCLFDYPSNSNDDGGINRVINVYDLQQNCRGCGYRGEFTDVCPKCGSKDILYGHGNDTLIFVTADELAAEGIELTADTDSVKNCFKLEAGDDLMTATVRNCNPNGTDYIWRLSESIQEDMSNDLVDRLKRYESLNNYYANTHITRIQEVLLSEYEKRTLIVDVDIKVGDTLLLKYPYESEASISYTDKNGYFGILYLAPTLSDGICTATFTVESDMAEIDINESMCVYLVSLSSYNDLIDKYDDYNSELSKISQEIVGYSELMKAYYDTIDLSLYLTSGLMPSIEMAETNATEQAALLTQTSLSPVAVNNENIESVSLATANSAVLSMAKIIVKSTYKVEIKNSEYNKSTHTWSGNFIVTNYSDENDTAESNSTTVTVNNDTETFVKQKIDKALNKDDTDDYSISGLFKKEYDAFCTELKKYALNPLKSFYDSCDACLNILIDQGAGNEKEQQDLYTKLYEPYYKKSSAISNEIKIRENEISIVEELQTYIEKCRSQIQSELNFESFLGEKLWLEFCAYRREDKYSNENYISDGLDNTQLFTKASEFFEVAKNEIYKSSELQYSISTSLKNLLAIPKFKPLVDSFEVGNWLRVQVDDKVYKLRLLEYGINFGDFDNIPVEFSEVTKVKNGVTDVKSILTQASSMASSYDSVKRQASQGEQSNAVLNNWFKNGLDLTQTKIVNNYDKGLLFDKNGFWCRQYDPITGTYSDEQIKIINSTIAITDDNWNTTKTAIGKFYYVDENNNEKVAYGINCETMVGKLILGEDLSIHASSGNLVFNGDGLKITSKSEDGVGTMTFNEDGLIVSHGDNTVTISPKSEEVMNITNGSDKVFEINESGELSINGNIMARSLKLESGVTIDSGVITNLANVATSGSYDDLVDVPTKLSDFENDGVFITKDANNLTNYYKKTELADVATSNDYNDLDNTPTIQSTVQSSGTSPVNGKAVYNYALAKNQGVSNAGKLLYVNDSGDITSISIDELKTLLGI